MPATIYAIGVKVISLIWGGAAISAAGTAAIYAAGAAVVLAGVSALERWTLRMNPATGRVM